MEKWKIKRPFCPLYSVLCPLFVETIDIVLFIELNWAKIYHTTFVTYLWDITLDIFAMFGQVFNTLTIQQCNLGAFNANQILSGQFGKNSG